MQNLVVLFQNETVHKKKQIQLFFFLIFLDFCLHESVRVKAGWEPVIWVIFTPSISHRPWKIRSCVYQR